MNLYVEGAIQYALNRLRDELSPTLYYHSLAHTRDDVLPAVEQFARLSAIQGMPLQLLRIAAWYHDIGFILQRANHEAMSAQIAREFLPTCGFHSQDVRQIEGMITATTLPQSPQTFLEELLADADLDVLGRDDFPTRNQALRAELQSAGVSFSDMQWYSQQYTFLQNHRYWTSAARQARDAGKQRNLAYMARLLADAQTATTE
jgi:uncharacterized protein